MFILVGIAFYILPVLLFLEILLENVDEEIHDQMAINYWIVFWLLYTTIVCLWKMWPLMNKLVV